MVLVFSPRDAVGPSGGVEFEGLFTFLEKLLVCTEFQNKRALTLVGGIQLCRVVPNANRTDSCEQTARQAARQRRQAGRQTTGC